MPLKLTGSSSSPKPRQYGRIDDVEDGATRGQAVVLDVPSSNPLKSLTATERSLAYVGIINSIYVCLQLIVATQTGSMAMLSDAFHNLSDVGAAYVAFKCERYRRDSAPPHLPFGYLRMQVLGAFVNAICLVSLAGYLILSALPLLFLPSSWVGDEGFTPTPSFIGVAATGVFLNLASAFLLCCGVKDAEGNPLHVHAHVGGPSSCECGALHSDTTTTAPADNEGDKTAAAAATPSTTTRAHPSTTGSTGSSAARRQGHPRSVVGESEAPAATPPPAAAGQLNPLLVNPTTAPIAAAECLDACCAPPKPPSATDASMQVPFGFLGSKNRSRRRAPVSGLPSPVSSPSNPPSTTAATATTTSTTTTDAATAEVSPPSSPPPSSATPDADVRHPGERRGREPVVAGPLVAPLKDAVDDSLTLQTAASSSPPRSSSSPSPPPPPSAAWARLQASSAQGREACRQCLGHGLGGGSEKSWAFSAFKWFGLDDNVVAVVVHSLGDAASSFAVLVVGVLVLTLQSKAAASAAKRREPEQAPGGDSSGGGRSGGSSGGREEEEEPAWLHMLDPLVTVALAAFMALAMGGVLQRSASVLLEASALSAPEAEQLVKDLEGDPSVELSAAGLRLASLVVTDLDFSKQARRASVTLGRAGGGSGGSGCGDGGGGGAGSGTGSDSRATSVQRTGVKLVGMAKMGDVGKLRRRVKAHLAARGVRWATVEIDVDLEFEP